MDEKFLAFSTFEFIYVFNFRVQYSKEIHAMKNSNLLAVNLFYLIFILSSVNAVSFKIVRIENCSSSNKSIQIDKCEGFENQITLILNVHRPLNRLNVSSNLNKRKVWLLTVAWNVTPSNLKKLPKIFFVVRI